MCSFRYSSGRCFRSLSCSLPLRIPSKTVSQRYFCLSGLRLLPLRLQGLSADDSALQEHVLVAEPAACLSLLFGLCYTVEWVCPLSHYGDRAWEMVRNQSDSFAQNKPLITN